LASPQNPLLNFSTWIRVTYHEVDGQKRVHHAQYLNYLERGRVEMLRAAGILYSQMESEGWMLVVRSAQIVYHTPAVFDDLLQLSIETKSARGARIVHQYRIERDGQLIVEATSEIACLNASGKVTRLPKHLQIERPLDDKSI
jgi:acyl-CoA thioester hydrolase